MLLMNPFIWLWLKLHEMSFEISLDKAMYFEYTINSLPGLEGVGEATGARG